MVQQVYRQIKTVLPNADVTIATSKTQLSAIKNQLGEKELICIELCRRDTFPAIVLEAYLHDVRNVPENESVTVCPVDPYVGNTYYETVAELAKLANEGKANLTLMGIEPTYPLEKYGCTIPQGNKIVSPVSEFREKPNVVVA